MKQLLIKSIAFSTLCLVFNFSSSGSIKSFFGKSVQAVKQQDIIELNKGRKWKVTENMLVHIRNMEKAVTVFEKSDKRDYKLLSEELKKGINLLTSNCTMKGKAHDELHKWLLPYIDKVNELAAAKNDNEASTKFQQIQNSFKTFNQYFE